MSGLLLVVSTSVLLAGLVGASGFAGSLVSTPLGSGWGLVAVTLVVIARGVIALWSHLMRAHGDRVGLAYCIGAPNLLALLLTAIVVPLKAGDRFVGWVPVAAYGTSVLVIALGCLISLGLRRTTAVVRSRDVRSALRRLPLRFVQGLPFVVSALTSVLLVEGAFLSSSRVLPADQVAEVAAVMRCSVVLAFAQTSLGWVVTSRLVEVQRDRARGHAVVRAAATVSLWTSGFLAMAVAGGAPLVLEGILGECSDAAVWTLRVVALAGVVRGTCGVADIYLELNGGQVVVARIMALAALVVLVASPLLALRNGIAGVGVAYLLSSCVVGFGLLCACWLRWKVWLVPTLRVASLGQTVRLLSRA